MLTQSNGTPELERDIPTLEYLEDLVMNSDDGVDCRMEGDAMLDDPD